MHGNKSVKHKNRTKKLLTKPTTKRPNKKITELLPEIFQVEGSPKEKKPERKKGKVQ